MKSTRDVTRAHDLSPQSASRPNLVYKRCKNAQIENSRSPAYTYQLSLVVALKQDTSTLVSHYLVKLCSHDPEQILHSYRALRDYGSLPSSR